MHMPRTHVYQVGSELVTHLRQMYGAQNVIATDVRPTPDPTRPQPYGANLTLVLTLPPTLPLMNLDRTIESGVSLRLMIPLKPTLRCVRPRRT